MIYFSYLKYNANIETSEADIPDMRDACPNEAGRILFNFSNASPDKELTML